MTDINWTQLRDQVATTLQDLVRFNTTNPPGNETALLIYLRDRLASGGIESVLLEPAPGRGNLIARLKGNGTERPLLLLSHVDVVAAEAEEWQEPPFSGNLVDGYIWGRGSVDMKGFTAVGLELLLLIKRLNLPLKRDVILAATADEEAGGTHGVGWLVENHYDLIDAEYALNEGGGLGTRIGDRWLFTCQTAQKGVCWCKLVARGEPGHGSMPRDNMAVDKLVKAVARLSQAQLPQHPIRTVEAYIRALSRVMPSPANENILDLLNPDTEPAALAQLSDREMAIKLRASLRNTAVSTVLRASQKINVIPSSAEAEVDGRLLPGQTVDDFLTELRFIVGEDVDIEVLHTIPGVETGYDTPLFRTITDVLQELEPHSLVTPSMSTGFTDSHYLIMKGCKVCGFWPMKHKPGEPNPAHLIHAHNERISVENLEFSARVVWEILLRLCDA